MPSYFAYGVNIQTELPCPELPPAEGEADVTVRYGAPPPAVSPEPRRYFWSRLTRQEARLCLEQVGAFTVLAGREVIVSPAPGVGESLLRLVLLGPVMGALLFQRGYLVLHASSVQVQGRAVAFMGAAGWGKSSLAAALVARGCPVVADDLTAVSMNAGPLAALPGYPRLKISREVKACLEIDEAALQTLDPAETKRSWLVPHGFQQRPLPLKSIFLLADGDDQRLEPVRPQEAVIELVRHSYPTRFREPGDGDHLKQCVQLAQQVPLLRLRRPDDISALRKLARLVEEEIENSVERVPR